MNNDDADRLEHLDWSVRSRFHNQRSALHLLRLFKEHEDQWKTKQWALAAQELLSVSFSLWRAAFLADKTAKRSAVVSHAIIFLGKIIEDNSISYAQDKTCNEWTFNYYTRGARAALETLHKHWPKQVPAFVNEIRAPVVRWDYCQGLLDVAVTNFTVLALEVREKKTKPMHASEPALTARAKRRRVRDITFAARKAAE